MFETAWPLQRRYNMPEFCCMEPCITHHNHFIGLGNSFTLSHCRQLRELEIIPPHMTETAGLDFFLSITSISIQKIIITHRSAFQEFPVGHTYWKEQDNVLYQLADRPGYTFLLEVKFAPPYCKWDGELDLKMYFPRFHEKGRVRLVDLGDE